jgi:AraC-like DNA-binding protein
VLCEAANERGVLTADLVVGIAIEPAAAQRATPRGSPRWCICPACSKPFRDSGLFPTLPEVAEGLDVHPRTLRRRLAEEGTSFRALLNEARSAIAVDLLRNVELTVEEVSTRLGYTEVSTFSHAFKRWYGVAPSAYSHRS